ncbi:hypothetical protein ITJ57_00640 [Plantibacter sp. VKM Ac-2880]|uniref:hypothetical protein n=1 Tax=Plantibacter sp. VKM Ac-2880 TaxID=2783827 RepID=UPI0018903B9D|nr:hypothetical protein [Plantibacter sp. VKM Ac-2880]MBF4567258.1 hypothetical protein [Plantibacter sp. VKM Ac-2880]
MSRGWNGFVAKSAWLPKAWRERAERALSEESTTGPSGADQSSSTDSHPTASGRTADASTGPAPATTAPVETETAEARNTTGHPQPHTPASDSGTASDTATGQESVRIMDPVALPVTASAPVVPLSVAITDFELADDSVIGPASVLDNLELTKAAVTRVAAAILSTEGPIAVPRLVTIVARRFGVDRLSEESRTELSALVTEAFVVQNGFAWPTGLDVVTWRGVRRVVHRDHRAVTDISPAEICNAMELVIAASPEQEVDREQLPMQAASVLGYGRLGETARRWLDLTLDQAVLHGRLVEDGERIRLP